MVRTLDLLEILERFDRVKVVLIGDLVLDRFILGTPKRISREAPVIILHHEGQRDIPGGAANALANLHALEVRSLPVGVVGDDDHGSALLELLTARGIDVSRIIRAVGHQTPTKVRILGGGASSLKHQVARYDIESELSDGPWMTQLQDHIAEACSRADAVALSDYGYGTAPPAVLSAVQGHSRPPWTCVDSRYRLEEFVGVDGATPNLEELEGCLGGPLHSDEQITAAANDLRSRLEASFLLATRGSDGMTLVRSTDPPFQLPVFGTDQVADVTGAGDTVLAVLVASLAAGATPIQAATLANCAGGIVVMKLGTATVTRQELAAAIKTLPGELAL
ncbi:MAG: hypothetical protein GY906_19675 [bacterium]|nr:hypothetical protein [bacterium]